MIRNSFVFFLTYLWICVPLHAQQITKAEYFFDNDPGPGLATPLSITPADSLNLASGINIGALSPGFHKLCVRVYGSTVIYNATIKYATGLPPSVTGITTTLGSSWSIYDSRSFYVSASAITPTVPGITAAEYYFDNDPGAGSGIALSSIANLDSVNITSNVNIGALTPGFHKLIVRTKDQRGIWSIYDTKSFYVTASAITQTVPGIVAAEYYFDNDPGSGNGIALSAITNLDSINITSNVNIGLLAPGFHILMVRTKDQRGIWSMYDSRTFYVPATAIVNTVPGIVAAEYYFDNDPGSGKGFALAPIANLDSVNITSNINIGTLTSGFHTVMIRTKDQRGVWGIYDSRSLYVPPAVTIPTVPGIVAAEYYYDNDPGVGKGIPMPAFAISDSINLTNNLPVGTLTGFHTVIIRVKDQRGIWNIYDSRNFYVKPSTPIITATGIAKMEYFIDNDPGPGKGFSMSIGPVSDSINITLNMALATIPSGFHNIGVRVKNTQGIWSQLDAKNIYIEPVPLPSVPDPINYAEFYFNHSDPGFGHATSITLGTFADSINITTNLNASSLFVGTDTVNLRVRTQSGKFSQTVSRPFTVCNNAPQAKFKFDTVCLGGPTHFINLTTGDNVFTTYIWDFRSTGVTNSTVAGSVNFIYPSPGTYTAKLTVSNGGPCFSVFTAQVAIISGTPAQPSPIAGFVSVCKGIQKYSITPLSYVKYAWNSPVLGTLTTNATKDTASVNWTSTGTNDLIQVIPSNTCGTGPPASLYVSVSNALSVSAGSNVAICKGDSIVLSASSASSYLWLNTGEITQSIKVKPSSTTGYIVQATQSNCTGKDTVFVVVTTVPSQISINQNADTLIATKITGGLYKWFFGGLQVGPGSNKFIPSIDGSYQVQVSIGSCNSSLSSGFNYVKPVSSCTFQSLTFPGILDKSLTDAPFVVPASASSGLPVAFTVVSGPAAFINSNTLSLTGAGIVAIGAIQTGDGTYCATGTITRYFQVTCANQSIFFNSLPDKTIGAAPFALVATVTSGLTPIFSVTSGPATLIGSNMISLTGVGGVAITASQPGNSTFCGANSVTRFFQVTGTTTGCTPQYITFPTIPNKYLSDTVHLTAYSTSNLTVTYAVLSGPAVLIAPGILSVTGMGIVNLSASQSGNGTYCAAGVTNQYFQVSCLNQSIFFNSLPDKTIGSAPFSLTATVTSGLPVTFTVTSGPATLIGGNMVSLTGTGGVAITASQTGNVTYCGANSITRYFLVNSTIAGCTPQFITFPSISNKYLGDTVHLTAYASSNLTVTYAVLSGPAILIAPGILSVTGMGIVNVSASQSGNGTYCTAGITNQYFQVSCINQNIFFNALPDKTIGDAPFGITATATSGLLVTFSVTSGPASLIGGNMISLTGVGGVAITASQAGNVTYCGANSITRYFLVNGTTTGCTPQYITFTSIQNKYLGDTVHLTAYSSSNLPVIYAVVSGPAVLIAPGILSVTGMGIVNVSATQAGNSTYCAAGVTNQYFQATCLNQSVFFNSLPDKTIGDAPFALSATVTSGLPVNFVVTSGPAVLTGNVLSITGTGGVVITASQPGNVTYCGANSIVRNFQVNCASQSIIFNPLQDKIIGDVPFGITATSTSGLPVTFAITNGPATLLGGNIVSLSGSGGVAITASQSGNSYYCNASSIVHYFQVNVPPSTCSPQTVQFAGISNKNPGDIVTLTGSSSSGLPVDFILNSGPALLVGNILTATGAGVISLSASQPGNATYCGASLNQFFQVTVPGTTKFTQTITSFMNIADRYQNEPPVLLSAFASSGLPIYFNIVSGPAVIVGDTLKTIGIGTVVVRASQPGDGTYFAASDAIQTFQVLGVIQKQPQVITFFLSGSMVTTNPPLRLFASASSGLRVYFNLVSGPALIVNDTFKITGKGVVIIKATQPGSTLFLPADSVVQTIQISEPGCPFIPTPLVSSIGLICSGNNVNLYAGEVANASGYLWTGPNNFSFTGLNVTLAGAKLGDAGIYSIVAINNNCTSAPNNILVDIRQTPPKPQITIQQGIACTGNDVLSVTAIYGSYKWSFDNYKINNLDSSSFHPVMGGVYKVEVSDSTKKCFAVSDDITFGFNGLGQVPTITANTEGTILTSSSSDSTYRWYLGKRLIVGEHSQNLSIYFNGIYKVETIAKNECKLMSKAFNINNQNFLDITRYAEFITDTTISIPKSGKNILEIFPNPAHTSFTINYFSKSDENVKAELFNLNSVMVLEKLMEKGSQLFHSTKMDVRDLPSGFYFIKITDGQITQCAKVVIY